MRGHLPIVTMRRAGYRPAVVFAEVCDAEPAAARGWHRDHPTIAVVWVEPSDSLQRLDLRMLRGLVVGITAEPQQRDRAERFLAAVHAAGAAASVAWIDHGREVETITPQEAEHGAVAA